MRLTQVDLALAGFLTTSFDRAKNHVKLTDAIGDVDSGNPLHFTTICDDHRPEKHRFKDASIMLAIPRVWSDTLSSPSIPAISAHQPVSDGPIHRLFYRSGTLRL
jgi:hypothetical protein